MASPEESTTERSPSPVNESLPPHTSEIGTLRKLPNHGTTWIGSSSGIYFVNTVRRAFSAAFSSSTSGPHVVPSSEDICGGEEESLVEPGDVMKVKDDRLVSEGLEQTLLSALGTLPDSRIASELVTSFFKTWHPLFPFLHGPKFIRDFESLYAQRGESLPGQRSLKGKRKPRIEIDTRRKIVIQLVINIASLDRPQNPLSPESQIKSAADVVRMAALLAQNHDILTIQTLLAAELYLVATIAIRQASMIAGIVLKLIFHSGLHRCPLRYAQLSAEDCEIRRRIFWSAYALDRHLSQALGDPLTLQDSDIDVCLSGRELHKPVIRDLLATPTTEINLHMPSKHNSTNEQYGVDPRAAHDTPEGRERQLREATLTAYVHYGRLTGRIIEIFHKSIHARLPKRDAILYLHSDIETWWNDLPAFLSGEDSAGIPSYQKQLQPYFSILYHQLLLLLHRPALSLDPASAEFQHGLQICIKTSRGTITALRAHQANGQSMFLPSVLSANWMAGLLIAFACQLGKYPRSRACSDLQTCLDLLQSMHAEWSTAKRINQVLSLLLANIKARKASANGFLIVARGEKNGSDDPRSDVTEPSRKKRRTARSDGSLTASPAKEMHTPTSDSRSKVGEVHAALAGSQPLVVPSQNGENGLPKSSMPSWTAEQHNDLFNQNNMSNLASMYSSDVSFPESNMFWPDLTANPDDQLFWGNLDFDTADVFGSATWENLAGSMAPSGRDWKA